MTERLQKVLSQWGVASRRRVEELVKQGRVQVNGTIAQLGQKVQPEQDRITVDGVVVNPVCPPKLLYLLLNKPIGYVSTCHDPQGRKTVLALLPPELRQGQGLHPVGRLDIDSSGALLLTNDGNLTFYLTHPRHHIPKTYQVWVKGYPSASTVRQWQQGVRLAGQLTLPATVTVRKRHPEQKTLLEIGLREGRNRQIRRVAEQLGHPVLQLHRTAIGTLQLQNSNQGGLPLGHYRFLTDDEIHSLNSQISLTSDRELAEKEYSR
ncbi:pseudouridine synthase [Pantanalinema rosaneae CENA516]|uniref:pseudouridine synthase n=1 Tax=Pantanalinema rosaneae TaxID=1620701 RepID=UPI003D6E9282